MKTSFVFQGQVKPGPGGTNLVVGSLSFRFGETSETMTVKFSCWVKSNLELGTCRADSQELAPLCKAAVQTLIDNDSLVM